MKQMLSALYGSDSSPYFIDEREQLAPDYSGSKGPSEGLNPGGPTPLCMAVAVPPRCMASHSTKCIHSGYVYRQEISISKMDIIYIP